MNSLYSNGDILCNFNEEKDEQVRFEKMKYLNSPKEFKKRMYQDQSHKILQPKGVLVTNVDEFSNQNKKTVYRNLKLDQTASNLSHLKSERDLFREQISQLSFDKSASYVQQLFSPHKSEKDKDQTYIKFKIDKLSSPQIKQFIIQKSFQKICEQDQDMSKRIHKLKQNRLAELMRHSPMHANQLLKVEKSLLKYRLDEGNSFTKGRQLLKRELKYFSPEKMMEETKLDFRLNDTQTPLMTSSSEPSIVRFKPRFDQRNLLNVSSQKILNQSIRVMQPRPVERIKIDIGYYEPNYNSIFRESKTVKFRPVNQSLELNGKNSHQMEQSQLESNASQRKQDPKVQLLSSYNTAQDGFQSSYAKVLHQIRRQVQKQIALNQIKNNGKMLHPLNDQQLNLVLTDEDVKNSQKDIEDKFRILKKKRFNKNPEKLRALMRQIQSIGGV